MYQQILDPVAHSLAWSSLVAALPLLLLFVMLGVLRVTAWVASLVSLALAIVLAVLVYGMPLGQTLLAGTEGAAFGFFPILWIVINAIWVYQMTVETGHFDVLRRSFARVSDDQRIQAVIIAFSFGALLEALAGFGTPVAVTSVMLMALGFKPIKAAALALTANTAPVAFGAMATPILTLGKVTELPSDTLGAMVGRQTPILALFVPLGAGRDRRRLARHPGDLAGGAGLRRRLRDRAVRDLQLHLGAAGRRGRLPAVGRRGGRDGARLAVRAATAEPAVIAGGAADEPTDRFRAAGRPTPTIASEVARAYAPYAIIIAVFVDLSDHRGQESARQGDLQVPLAGAAHRQPQGKARVADRVHAEPAHHAGHPDARRGRADDDRAQVVGASGAQGVRRHAAQLRFAIVTVMAVLALAFVMNLSGQTITLGTWMAGAGGAFALLSPVLGWLGVAVTGSDTSANSLFGALQVTAANQAGLSDVLMAASNSSGGVLGKMISPQNLAIAAAAVGMNGKEGDIFRRVVVWSLAFLALLCVLSALQASVLSWMVP